MISIFYTKIDFKVVLIVFSSMLLLQKGEFISQKFPWSPLVQKYCMWFCKYVNTQPSIFEDMSRCKESYHLEHSMHCKLDGRKQILLSLFYLSFLCAGSSLLHLCFLQLQASHCGDFSNELKAHGLSSCSRGLVALWYVESSLTTN